MINYKTSSLTRLFVIAIAIVVAIALTSCATNIPKSQVNIPGFESQGARSKSKAKTQGVELGFEDAAQNIEEIVAKDRGAQRKNRELEQDQVDSLEAIFLLEIQASRGENIPETIEGMIIYAETHKNEDVAKRAYELSRQIYNPSVAKDIARRWYALALSSDEAQQVYIRQLLIDSDYPLAFEVIAKRIDQRKAADFSSIARYYQVVDEKQTENLITSYNRYARTYQEKKNDLSAGGMIARYKLAHFLFYQENYTKSLRLLNLILSSPKQAKALNLLQQASELKTRIYYLTDNPNADAFYKQATRNFPASYSINVYYGLHLLRQDRAEQAEEFFVNWATKHLTQKKDIYKLLTLGIGAYKASLNDLYVFARTYIEKHSNEEEAILLAGALAFAIGNVGSTESLLDRLDPSSAFRVPALKLRIKNAVAANEFEAAEDLLAEIATEDRRIFIYLTGQYVSELILKNEEKRARRVIVALSKRLRKDPDTSEAVAYMYYELGDNQAMSKEFESALRLSPDDPNLQNGYGYSLADKDVQLKKAAKLINAAIEANPISPAFVDSLGWLSYRQGNLQEAKYLLEWAYRVKADPEIAAHLGEVLWLGGQQQRARYLMLLNSELYPDSKVLNDTMDRFKINSDFLRKDSEFFTVDFLD